MSECMEVQPARLSRFVPIAVVVFLGLMAMGMPLGSVPAFVNAKLGYGMTVVGLVMGVESVATLLTRHFAGVTADRKGPKIAVTIGLIGSFASGAFYFVGSEFAATPALGLALVVVGRIAMGFAQGLLFTGGSTWPIGIFGASNAGKALSWIGIAMFAGISAGAALAAALNEMFGFRIVALATAVIPLIGLLIAVRLPNAHLAAPAGHKGSALRTIRKIWRPGLVFGLATVGYVTVTSFVAVAYMEKGWSGAEYALSAFGIGYVSARLLLGSSTDRNSSPVMAVGMLSIEAVGQLLIWQSTSPSMSMLGAALSGFGVSMIYPLLALVAIRGIARHDFGMAIGFYDACFDIAIGLSAPLAGVVAKFADTSAVFVVGVVCSLAAIAMAISVYRGEAALHQGGE
ncbi:MFS transporter [Burkholderia sp. ABCPW 111]|uniref:MFS transporter n=1 Tax=Burkholderia sp. ABCPW 111 TaxID=1820025 RepID=UPI000531D27A|nr:MFS transporter [Burkholderia sp. ABCPW 111]KGR93524.1 major Facilitator Superfamily protein [Burkholderia sp. ABCPW 111]